MNDILKSLQIITAAEQASKPLTESAKPDYLDMDKDGDKKEPMKKALKDKEKVDEAAEGEAEWEVTYWVEPPSGKEYSKDHTVKAASAKEAVEKVKKMADKHAYGFEARKVAKKVDEAEESKVYRHKGTYGTEYDPNGKAKTAEPAKRGRGRPRKDAGTDGEVKKYDWSAFGGKVSIPAHKGKVTKHKMAGESKLQEAAMARLVALLEEAVALEKKMTADDKAEREKIVKGMKKDTAGLKKRYGKRWKDVMYATATKQAMKEGLSDIAKKVGGAAKKVAGKALDTLGHGSDEELIKDLQKKTGMPQTGKKPMAGPVKESTVMECGMDAGSSDDLTIMGSANALVTMLKLAGMDSSAAARASAPAPMAPSMHDMEADVDAMGGDMLDVEDEMSEEYANSPDEMYSELDAVIGSGDDLHRSKGAYPKAAGGDNPMALEEIWESYEALKKELL